MIYHSKKDTWLVALVAGVILIPLVIGYVNLVASAGNFRLGWILLSCSVLIGGVTLLLAYPLYYEITPYRLNHSIRHSLAPTNTAQRNQGGVAHPKIG